MDREPCYASALQQISFLCSVLQQQISSSSRPPLRSRCVAPLPGNQVGSGDVACGPGNSGRVIPTAAGTFAAPRTPSKGEVQPAGCAVRSTASQSCRCVGSVTRSRNGRAAFDCCRVPAAAYVTPKLDGDRAGIRQGGPSNLRYGTCRPSMPQRLFTPKTGNVLLVEIGPEGWTPTQQPPESFPSLRSLSRDCYFYLR
jgi:hypothetical protein